MVDWGALFVTYYVLAVPSIFFYLRNIAVKQRKRHARLEADDARARARWKQARAEKEKKARVSRRKSAGKSGDDLKAALAAAAQAQQRPLLSAFAPTPDAPTVNPFVNHTWSIASLYERLKYSVLGPVLVPARGAVLVASLLASAVVANAAVLGLSEADLNDRPLVWWRRLLRLPLQYLTRLSLFALGITHVKFRGRRAAADEAPLVVANHLGFLEPLILGAHTGGMPVSRIENARIPLFGALVKCYQPIYVDRSDPKSRQAVRAELIRRTNPGNGWPQVLIFPEGTTHNQDALICFKAGAFAPGRAVQPVAVSLPFEHFDPCWVTAGPSLGELALRLMCQPQQTAEITYLPVYKPSAAERADARLFANNVRSVLAAALGVPTTEHSYDDVRLQHEAKVRHAQGGLLSGAAGVEMRRLRGVLDVDANTAKKYLASFVAVDRDGSGRLTFAEFCEAFGRMGDDDDDDEDRSLARQGSSGVSDPLKEQKESGNGSGSGSANGNGNGKKAKRAPGRVPAAAGKLSREELAHFFHLLDEDDSGLLSFREFLVGLTILNEKKINTAAVAAAAASGGGDADVAGLDAALRFAFGVFADDSGTIGHAALVSILRRAMPHVSDARVAELWAEADADMSGRVDEGEFLRFAKAHADALPLFRETFFGRNLEDDP